MITRLMALAAPYTQRIRRQMPTPASYTSDPMYNDGGFDLTLVDDRQWAAPQSRLADPKRRVNPSRPPNHCRGTIYLVCPGILSPDFRLYPTQIEPGFCLGNDGNSVALVRQDWRIHMDMVPMDGAKPPTTRARCSRGVLCELASRGLDALRRKSSGEDCFCDSERDRHGGR